MGNISKWPVLALTSLLALSIAVPNPLGLLAATIPGDTLGNILPNTTLAAVIPVAFTIRPSLPLDEPVLDSRGVLTLTMDVLGNLALEDFNGAQESETWRSGSRVSLDVVGPTMDIEAPIPMRKYALWGVYKAVHSMVAANDFRSRIYELFWQRTLVGYLSFNDGTAPLGIEKGPANETSTAIPKSNLTTSLNILSDAMSINPVNSHIQLGFTLSGRNIGEFNVFMTLFTGILKAAPYPRSDRVDEFIVNARTFNAWLSLTGQEDIEPNMPFFMYEHLILLFTRLPEYVLQHGGRWVEAEMAASVDGKVVGAGVLKYQERVGAGVMDLGDVASA